MIDTATPAPLSSQKMDIEFLLFIFHITLFHCHYFLLLIRKDMRQIISIPENRPPWPTLLLVEYMLLL